MFKVLHKISKLVRWMVEGAEIPFLVLCVGQKCSLKCRDCGNLAPYAKKSNLSYDYKSIISDLEIFTSNIKYIDELQIQGGEPLIYKNLDKIIEYVGKNKKIRHVSIRTNSTIMPNSKLIDLMKKYHVSISLSSYPITVDKRTEIYEKMKSEKIECTVYECLGDEDKKKWRDMGYMIERETDTKIAIQRFKTCAFHVCTTMENGVIGHCSRSTNAPSVQKYTPAKGELLSVRKRFFRIRLIGWMLYPIIFKNYSMECCRRCLGSEEGPEIDPAIQL